MVGHRSSIYSHRSSEVPVFPGTSSRPFHRILAFVLLKLLQGSLDQVSSEDVAERDQEDKDVQYYLNRAGGLTPEAASKEMYLLKGDGSAIAGFMSLRSIEPGDVIIVPPSTEAKVEYWSLMKDIASILGEVGKVAIGVAGLGVIF